MREENNEVIWGRISEDVVPVNVVCIRNSPETVLQITAYNRLVEKIFDVCLTQPGNKILFLRSHRRHPFTIFTRRGRGEAQMSDGDAFGPEGKGSSQCGRSQRKLEPTDVILSSSHAKNVVFGQN